MVRMRYRTLLGSQDAALVQNRDGEPVKRLRFREVFSGDIDGCQCVEASDGLAFARGEHLAHQRFCIHPDGSAQLNAPGVPGLDLPGFDFVSLAKGYGCKGRRIVRPEDPEPALRDSKRIHTRKWRKKRPTCKALALRPGSAATVPGSHIRTEYLTIVATDEQPLESTRRQSSERPHKRSR